MSEEYKKHPIKVRVEHAKTFKGIGGLEWTDKEEEELTSRIVKLRDDQIAALSYLVYINYAKSDIGHVLEEIRERGVNSINLDTIIYEADSKENILWWVDFFEKENKKHG